MKQTGNAFYNKVHINQLHIKPQIDYGGICDIGHLDHNVDNTIVGPVYRRDLKRMFGRVRGIMRYIEEGE